MMLTGGGRGPLASPPMRPMLRPGVPILRRSVTEYQVGVHRPVVLPITPTVREALRALTGTSAVPPEGMWVVQRLERHLVTGPAEPEPLRVRVDGDLGFDIAALLGALDVTVTDRAPDLVLMQDTGLPSRARGDGLLQEGRPHLPIAAVDGALMLGPFVMPGESACLRCVDHAAGERRPWWPRLLAQLEAPSPYGGRVDPALVAVAAGWAARDICTWRDGGTPGTWNTTLIWHPDLREAAYQTWARWPDCGCSWDALEADSAGRALRQAS